MDIDFVDIDFVEIGTSNFSTIIEECGEDVIGFSIEPIKYYLDCLPDKKNVKKINVAITSNRDKDFIDIYYIPESVINEENLHPCLKGCNTIGDYHPLHIAFNYQKFVIREQVRLLNIDEFLKMYNIRNIKFLKIDTEGHDVCILNGLFDYISKLEKIYYPNKIMFESNEHTPTEKVDRIIERSLALGYKVNRGYDTILEL